MSIKIGIGKVLRMGYLPPAPPTYNTFYIDPLGVDGAGVDGSAATPWLTLEYACTRVLTPGDYIHVNAGNYTEPNQIVVAPGVNIQGVGVLSNIISTYVAADSNDASILLSSALEGSAGNQSISYIKLDGSALTASYGILVNHRSDVIIHHCTFVDFLYAAVNFHGSIILYGTVIYSTGNQFYNNDVDNCSERSGLVYSGQLMMCGQDGLLIHNNTFTQNTRAAGSNGNIITGVEGEFKGVKIYNNTFTKLADIGAALQWDFHIEVWNIYGGMEIYSNQFYEGGQCIDNGGYGNVKGTYTYSMWVHDNLFQQTVQPVNQGGSRLKMGVDIEHNNDGIIVNNNHFKNLPWGVYIVAPAGIAAPKILTDIHIYSNIFENVGYSTVSDFTAGIYITSGDAAVQINNVFIYNNTFTIDIFSYACVYIDEACVIDEIYITNNILVNAFFGGIEVDGGFAGALNHLYAQNNLYYSCGTDGITYPNGGSATNLVENGTQIGDPTFVGAADFHLVVGSPAIANGLAVATVLKDYDYVDFATPRAIGAYEFV